MPGVVPPNSQPGFRPIGNENKRPMAIRTSSPRSTEGDDGKSYRVARKYRSGSVLECQHSQGSIGEGLNLAQRVGSRGVVDDLGRPTGLGVGDELADLRRITDPAGVNQLGAGGVD